MLIAIDTATKYLGLALYNDQTLIAEQMWLTGNQHNMLLAPSIEKLLTICGVAPSDLTMVAVTNGHGSYTGLRIGVAMAKGLASVKQLPLIGMNTLDIIAVGQDIRDTSTRLLCIIPAGRKRIIVGEYESIQTQWQAIDEPNITTWDALLASLDFPSYDIAGEIDEIGQNAIQAFKHDDIRLNLVDVAQRGRRVALLAQEAWRRYHAGDPQDFLPAKLVPLYLSEPG